MMTNSPFIRMCVVVQSSFHLPNGRREIQVLLVCNNGENDTSSLPLFIMLQVELEHKSRKEKNKFYLLQLTSSQRMYVCRYLVSVLSAVDCKCLSWSVYLSLNFELIMRRRQLRDECEVQLWERKQRHTSWRFNNNNVVM